MRPRIDRAPSPEPALGGRIWIAAAAACAFALAVPVLATAWPPCTDLPQHVAQMRLVGEALHDPSGGLALNWLWPNTLVYAIFGAGWLVLPPEHVGRFVVVALGWMWVAAAFFVAWRRGRPLASAVLATVIFFNHAVYWGFVNFLVGWPVFLLWVLAVDAPPGERGTRRDLARLLVLGALLYFAHALWFLAGLGWLGLTELVGRDALPIRARRLAALAPVIAMAATWYPQLAALRRAAGFDVGHHWVTSPLYRLQPGALRDAAFGGLYGPLETWFALLIAAWIAAALLTRRRGLPKLVDRTLLLAAAALLVVVLFGPDGHLSTILFWSRWMPCAVILILLALPAPRLPSRWATGLALAAVLVFVAVTAGRWAAFGREELTGFDAALGRIAPRSRVLGLDFVEDSAIVKGRPFMQMFAYATVLDSASLNFSFTQHASSIVRYRTPPKFPWTSGLEWHAHDVEDTDLRYFDYVLTNATDEIHAQLRARPELAAVGGGDSGRWRLYRVRDPVTPSGAVY